MEIEYSCFTYVVLSVTFAAKNELFQALFVMSLELNTYKMAVKKSIHG